jgi:mitochondrial fission protein ELM1
MKTGTPRIWVLTDGRAGNEAQALGVAEALARRIPVEISAERVIPKGWAARLPARLWHMLGARADRWPFTGYHSRLSPPWPDLAIGAGRRVAPLVAALGRLYGVKTVQIMNPRMPLSAFDLVVAPAHDNLGRDNVVATLGAPGRVTPERVAQEAGTWAARLAHLPPRRVACLIGGSTRGAFWREEDVDRLVDQIAELSHSNIGVMITASRRTDPVVMAGLKAECDPAAAFIWEGSGDNPYPAILGLAEAALVTEDSVNMACEAASAGLPVHVFRVAERSAKIAAFQEALARHGAARTFTGEIDAWSYPPLVEADRVAGEILARLM